ncbi:SNF1-related protein kinase regulatory subunit gamma-1-like [Vicia villosa]|uniref:SNF1-related protein kinase regulatory subunit gamma-1-like n=1 Tax=Vicia villosa TaxID=3911 RepID=UPI00273BAABA|nr:SNF1-related protein kinase regulatory subunit gamma-1-like [Vicia villosa]
MQSMQIKEDKDDQHGQVDSASALQQYLDLITITSISGIYNSLVLEIKAGDTIRDAIHMLYEKETFGAAIVDVLDTETSDVRFSDRYIGFISFPNIILWCLEEYENIKEDANDNHSHLKDIEHDDLFSILDQIPQIGQTKVGELAKSFLWEPFFPVHLNDTILHALLLLSKHRLQVLPVIQQPDAPLIGFVTQNALVELLLRSSELEWFDNIANKNLSDFRFEGQEHPRCVFGSQSVADALKLLWQNQTCAVAVVDRQTKKLIGNVRNSDIYNLVKNNDLLRNRRILTVEEFLRTETDITYAEPITENDHGANQTAGNLRLKNSSNQTAGNLRLKNSSKSRMDSPVSNKENDTLKQVMQQMAKTNSSFSFLINGNQQVTGLITVRDIILQFAPPCVNSSIGGGGFFELALEQSKCHISNGTIIRNR